MKRRNALAAAAALLAAALLCAVPAPGARAGDAKLRVLATTTDLREIAREVGGDDVEVTCLMKGPEDPHFLEARPSMVRAAASADALLVTGLDLEVGYEPVLLGDSRNARIQKGAAGYVDCSKGIEALQVPAGAVDRSQGDVHAHGNPHYLLDPVRGKQAAATVAEAFAALAPERADGFRDRLADFRRRVDTAMFGEEVLAAQPAERLERRLRDGTLAQFLKDRGLEGKLGGLAAEMLPYAGRKVVVYHGTYAYLLDRFHLEETASLEPKPGIPPTPKHLQGVVETMRSAGVMTVLYAPFQPERTARTVAEQAGGTALRLAHQPDAIPGTSGYVETLRVNVAALAKALSAEPPR
jgi:ABC-type Zn uptake system ZnuABC Zn-binding protein ZnuA